MKIVELFAGAGGLALGAELAGFEPLILNELDKHAVNTLKLNKPDWNVIQSDIKELDFTQFKADVVSGGIPCQAFSYAGNKLGFKDERGAIFFEFLRVVQEIKPKAVVIENVKGLVTHNKGETLDIMIKKLIQQGYHYIDFKVLNSLHYNVPQKRERLIVVATRDKIGFSWPVPSTHVRTLSDVLQNVPDSIGKEYPAYKKKVLELIPEGGYWRDLPEDLQKEYMGKSYYSSGGKTGIARRLSWNEPSLTLTCSPDQKQTERCHPSETRPLNVREYGRIQTFPDNWNFSGPITSQYKQIGNALPVNLAKAIFQELYLKMSVYYNTR